MSSGTNSDSCNFSCAASRTILLIKKKIVYTEVIKNKSVRSNGISQVGLAQVFKRKIQLFVDFDPMSENRSETERGVQTIQYFPGLVE